MYLMDCRKFTTGDETEDPGDSGHASWQSAIENKDLSRRPRVFNGFRMDYGRFLADFQAAADELRSAAGSRHSARVGTEGGRALVQGRRCAKGLAAQTPKDVSEGSKNVYLRR